MDLRAYVRTQADIAEAKALIAQGHFIYQPFRITDDLEVGAAMSSSTARRALV